MILDTSAAVPLLFDHALSDVARRAVSGQSLVSPALVGVETANALWEYAMRDGLTAHQLAEMVSSLTEIVEIVPDAQLLSRAVELAVEHRHPVYDCLYLALALQRREPLATADRRLAALARQLAIETELIEPA